MSCLNTTLVILMFSNQKSQMPNYLKSLRDEKATPVWERKGGLQIMRNFRYAQLQGGVLLVILVVEMINGKMSARSQEYPVILLAVCGHPPYTIFTTRIKKNCHQFGDPLSNIFKFIQ